MSIAGTTAAAAARAQTPSPEAHAPLAARGVGKAYGADDGDGELNQVIEDISFTLRAGEIVSLVGPSGCGKTTLLNLMSGLVRPTRGAVFWHGRPLLDVPKGIGYMLQKDMLMAWRTALGNVTLGLELAGMPRARREKKAHTMLAKVGLGPFYDYYPSALSGGMRQRVALARTLVTDPEVILLDEPFAALDFQTKVVLESDMARLVRSEGRSVLLITHDVEEAVSLSDRVIVLTHRPSRIKAIHDIRLAGDRNDMMAARDAAGFTAHVREIWSQLDVRMGER
ncbi:Hydroxymethylpyrimidine ABC transporter, ATPase component [Caballeronia glathei]|jgi:NitT/TauT family transport system ATP-binding protein|uniref:Spermidine/putrescine ABC transporter ATP-binding protein n=1 Tax=Caballeronia glathei TaxID=60547 RepID=A0A069Q3D8_9BURK|nr:ABC transporter ATP-binding protein [Caballeronia glathei]KDR44306.1 spermidine/putrescine ABC transporter ATP-binding protein [Caballeronia glathei]CDY77592.1 Hydroxymethylpyrimidine ABC transporter, ATPase component [Caballeronia glathei]